MPSNDCLVIYLYYCYYCIYRNSTQTTTTNIDYTVKVLKIIGDMETDYLTGKGAGGDCDGGVRIPIQRSPHGSLHLLPAGFFQDPDVGGVAFQDDNLLVPEKH